MKNIHVLHWGNIWKGLSRFSDLSTYSALTCWTCSITYVILVHLCFEGIFAREVNHFIRNNLPIESLKLCQNKKGQTFVGMLVFYFWLQDPYILFLRDFNKCKNLLYFAWVTKCIGWFFVIIEICQNWKLPKSKMTKIESCQN